jgi:O-acetyl-ADP-ribose deacetylase (regulator of RNase III)
LFHNILEVGGP